MAMALETLVQTSPEALKVAEAGERLGLSYGEVMVLARSSKVVRRSDDRLYLRERGGAGTGLVGVLQKRVADLTEIIAHIEWDGPNHSCPLCRQDRKHDSECQIGKALGR